MNKSVEAAFKKILSIDKYQLAYRVSRKIYLQIASSVDDKLHTQLPTAEQLENISAANNDLIKNLHIVGNSHAHSFTGSKLGKFGKGDVDTYPWNSYSLGPLSSIDLIGRKWELFEKLAHNQSFKPGDGVLLPFGEAECRWYSLKNHEINELNQFSDSELRQLIQPYLDSASEAFTRISDLGFRVVTWSGHISMAATPRDDAIVPVYGSLELRTRLGKLWSDAINEISKSKDYCFLDFLSNQLEIKQSNWKEILEDEIHLNSRMLAGFMFGSFNFAAY